MGWALHCQLFQSSLSRISPGLADIPVAVVQGAAKPDQQARLASGQNPQAGFTLLEMMVVLVLVGLISAMLMQGFVYVAGIFSSVESRQQYWQQQLLQRSWLQESVSSLTNGVDGPLAKPYFFQGDNQGFTGLALQGLSYAGGVGRPVRIQWRLHTESATAELSLQYRELKLGEDYSGTDDQPWYTVVRWQAAAASFDYYSQERWQAQFSGRPVSNAPSPRLPELVRLRVEAGPRSLELWMAVASYSGDYLPPEDRSANF